MIHKKRVNFFHRNLVICNVLLEIGAYCPTHFDALSKLGNVSTKIFRSKKLMSTLTYY